MNGETRAKDIARSWPDNGLRPAWD